MLQKISQAKLMRMLCFLMAAYLLNISVDSPDILPHKAEDLSFNDQESIVEIVIEKILDYDTLIPEIDDNDSNEQSPIKKNFQLDFYLLFYVTTEPLVKKNAFTKSLPIWKKENVKLAFYKNFFPPPEV